MATSSSRLEGRGHLPPFPEYSPLACSREPLDSVPAILWCRLNQPCVVVPSQGEGQYLMEELPSRSTPLPGPSLFRPLSIPRPRNAFPTPSHHPPQALALLGTYLLSASASGLSCSSDKDLPPEPFAFWVVQMCLTTSAWAVVDRPARL